VASRDWQSGQQGTLDELLAAGRLLCQLPLEQPALRVELLELALLGVTGLLQLLLVLLQVPEALAEGRQLLVLQAQGLLELVEGPLQLAGQLLLLAQGLGLAVGQAVPERVLLLLHRLLQAAQGSQLLGPVPLDGLLEFLQALGLGGQLQLLGVEVLHLAVAAGHLLLAPVEQGCEVALLLGLLAERELLLAEGHPQGSQLLLQALDVLLVVGRLHRELPVPGLLLSAHPRHLARQIVQLMALLLLPRLVHQQLAFLLLEGPDHALSAFHNNGFYQYLTNFISKQQSTAL
jgi:hypothetical protein